MLSSVKDFAHLSEMENIGGLWSEQVSPGRLLSCRVENVKRADRMSAGAVATLSRISRSL